MPWSRLTGPPNGEYFDFATGDSISALEMLQKIAAAGKSYFLLNTQSVASVGREGVKPWTGAITPHEMVSEMQTDFVTVTDDDYDGVDVTYINGSTGQRRRCNAVCLATQRR